MQKAFKKKFSQTKLLVKKVLSNPSTSIQESNKLKDQMDREAELKSELDSLKDQLSNLKAAIQSLQNECEQKDISIATLARDKEKITIDLLRTKRTNTTLAKQLEEERNYYFKEKETYCHEMNECKRLKKFISNSSIGQSEKTIEEHRNEISRLKETLNQTLEANYNLSIKFLRMKNTKTCLKTELQAIKLEHEKLANEYKTKIENLASELNDLVTDKLNDSISPSSKKYLQLVKQNSCLVYENLCLQLEVDNLNYKIGKMQQHSSKTATNAQLSYITHKIQPELRYQSNFYRKTAQIEAPEKLETEPKPCCSKNNTNEYETVKIFSRQKSTEEVKKKEKKHKKKKKTQATEVDKKKSDIKPTPSIISHNYNIKVDDKYREKIANYDLAKLALFQVSNVTSSTSSNFLTETGFKRSQSSPDIVQSSYCHK